MILRARTILPLLAPPIENGAVRIAGNKILAVGEWKKFPPPAREKIIDLGEVILLPGLVNAHCHLDYTDMAGELPPPNPAGRILITRVLGCTAHINFYKREPRQLPTLKPCPNCCPKFGTRRRCAFSRFWK
jgi:hypothetical protein